MRVHSENILKIPPLYKKMVWYKREIKRGANWFCLPHYDSTRGLTLSGSFSTSLEPSGHAHQLHLQCIDPLPPQELLSSLPVGLDGGSGPLFLCSLWCLCTVGKCMFVYRQINKKLVPLRCNYFLVTSISFLLNHNCTSRP